MRQKSTLLAYDAEPVKRFSSGMFHLRGDSCFLFRVSCLSTCLVRMPPRENFAPSLIRSRIAASPSILMTVRLPRSMTSLRPPSSCLAVLQFVRSSPTHDPMRVPSTTSVRCDRVSMVEILNISLLLRNRLRKLDTATLLPKPGCPAPWQPLESIGHGRSRARDVSKNVEVKIDNCRGIRS